MLDRCIWNILFYQLLDHSLHGDLGGILLKIPANGHT